MIRAALWFVGLFALAVAIALFAGNNEGMVSLFWSPYRVDISLNMLLLALLATFAIGYAALRAFSALLMLPQNASAGASSKRAPDVPGLRREFFPPAGRPLCTRQQVGADLAQAQR